MLSNISPYLYFEGRCEEALNFYARVLNGHIKSLMRVNEGPKEFQRPGMEKQVMHSELVIGKASVLASDSMGGKVPAGKNVYLNLKYEKVEELDEAWKNLLVGGKVTMELQDTFWGARFGMLQDKFGINWMFNCDKKA